MVLILGAHTFHRTVKAVNLQLNIGHLGLNAAAFLFREEVIAGNCG